MPELPEVEIHARNLREWLVGRTVVAYAALDPLLAMPPVAISDTALLNARVTAVQRRAKHLLVDLSSGWTLAAHLRMTGRFVRDSYVTDAMSRFTRFWLTLDSGERVRFEDRRRFGRIQLAPTTEVSALPELAHLGPDALLEPTSSERLAELCRGVRRSIKALLLDQSALGGLGNICVIEILYRAGIAPQTPAGELSEGALDAIAAITPSYLEWAIDVQSRRELIYLGEKGAENVFTIYRREGASCPRCGATIIRTRVAGRGTYYCPGCQH